ncbi:hypothetical protein NDU88_005890 [Pleurodeles waltl]|uniref:Uncharacterized protein n=1 Tax=Pleurodeles waltl TaxID=8319 RepID=A0AAV7WD42_PLEWA|nr:hypothetical protein NDU88_005890 [Pleurodeles waltl]
MGAGLRTTEGAIIMGKADYKLAKLSFDARKKPGASSRQFGDNSALELVSEEVTKSKSIKAMFLKLKQSLSGMDSKLNQLTDRMDRLKEKVDDHDPRLDQLEHHASDLDDGQSTSDEHLPQMEKAAYRDFLPVKRTLLQMAAMYYLIYPVKLRVTFGGKLHFFIDSKRVKTLPKKPATTSLLRESEDPGRLCHNDCTREEAGALRGH